MLNSIKEWIKFKRIKNTQGTVFLSRLTIYFKNGSLKLHLITGDDSPEYHNHPWDFTSFVLFGGYNEWMYAHPDHAYVSPKARYMFTFNTKQHKERHRVELFKLFGYKIPTITIGWYSHKIQLCSFCQKAGYCLQSKQH